MYENLYIIRINDSEGRWDGVCIIPLQYLEHEGIDVSIHEGAMVLHSYLYSNE